jgi:uncharacterized protein (TIGR02270 family)
MTLPSFSPDILDQHLEGLEFLSDEYQAALRSPDYDLEDLAGVGERIEAHVQGVVLVGEAALPRLEEALSDEDPAIVFSAALPLLRMKSQPAADLVAKGLAEAEEGPVEGYRRALRHGPIDLVEPAVQRAFESGNPSVSVVAAEILAFHSRLSGDSQRLVELLCDETPAIRSTAWGVAGLVDSSGDPRAERDDSRPYSRGLEDEDEDVRTAALYAAAWAGQTWVETRCRECAKASSPRDRAALHLLAILGQPSDLEIIRRLGSTVELGPERFGLLGAFGHPAIVGDLLSAMESETPAEAAAAATAFTKITDRDVESQARATVPPEDGSEPDEFEKEFLDEVVLPDRALARQYWDELEPEFSAGTRWCRARNLSHLVHPMILDELDLESRWEACLRGRRNGSWAGNLRDLHRLVTRVTSRASHMEPHP